MQLMRLASAMVYLALFATGGAAQNASQHVQPILARDVDKRTLPKVTMNDLSPAMRNEVQSLIDDLKEHESDEYKNRATPPSLETTIYRIPVGTHGHRLYFVEQTGELAWGGIGVNCAQTVLDETRDGVETVTGGSGVGISVVRRPNLQMPDIVEYEQLGHFATSITVHRFKGSAWHNYLCKEISPMNEDPNPAVIADKPCK